MFLYLNIREFKKSDITHFKIKQMLICSFFSIILLGEEESILDKTGKHDETAISMLNSNHFSFLNY